MLQIYKNKTDLLYDKNIYTCKFVHKIMQILNRELRSFKYLNYI